jgi:predicted nucleic acid-binding Zn ribbon protein
VSSDGDGPKRAKDADVAGTGEAGAAAEEAQEEGPDAVRSALNRARAAARARGLKPGSPPAAPGGRRRRGLSDNMRSGARADARDPQSLGATLGRLVAERGWETPVAVGGVMGRWDAVVGPDIAGHCAPTAFDEGVLTVQAESTAWATQVRLLVPTLMRRLAEEVGEGTVTKVVVHGPTAPSWRRGLRVAPGSQGPRDTYG